MAAMKALILVVQPLSRRPRHFISGIWLAYSDVSKEESLTFC